MVMNLINVLAQGNYKKYYRYFTIDKCGDMTLWKHKPRAGAYGYWDYGRPEYTHDIKERINFGTINNKLDNWETFIWKIQ